MKLKMSLYLPDQIQVFFVDKFGHRFQQENILIGIRTYSSHKNDIDLSPFLSDKEGQIIINKNQLITRSRIFAAYGNMDLASLESTKANILIYLWGNDRIEKYLNYWNIILKNRVFIRQYRTWGNMNGRREKTSAETEIREVADLNLFENCFNRSTKLKEDMLLVSDKWNKPLFERNYNIRFPQ